MMKHILKLNYTTILIALDIWYIVKYKLWQDVKGAENVSSHRMKTEINFTDHFQNNLKSLKCMAE
jgi:hypothetical protein